MVVDSNGNSTAKAMATKKLAGKYGMDVELLEKLVRSVNVPSEREMMPSGGAGSVRRYVRDAESGEDIAVREVSYFLPMS